MKALTALIAFCLVLTASAQIPASEKQALVDLYNYTNGSEWTTTWNLNTPESTWHGVEIKNNTVVSIDLGFNNLQGELPASIGNLSNLECLKLFFNQIEGSLPSEIGSLKNLKTLDLNSNNIAGALPSSISELIHLEELLLSSNNFTGTLPSGIVDLNQLKTLVLFDNHFYGEFPLAIASMENLKELVVAKNSFDSESLQTSLAAISAQGITVDFNENKSLLNNNNSEFATLVMDDEDN